MEIRMKYGSGEMALDFPGSAVEITHREPVPNVDHDKFKRDIYAYLYTLNRKLDSVGIVISDKTRLCEFPVYLPLITESLHEYGVQKEAITFYIAYGTHPRQSEEECLAAYGETYREYRFVHHDSRNEEQMTGLGTTSRGTEVRIHGALMEHDLLITFGAILHHYFAGFGGGRKLLFPGMAAYGSILQNHSLFLDFEHRRLSEGCRSGHLNGNPLAEDLEEIEGMLPVRLEIFGILDSGKQVCEIHFGLHYGYFRDACDHYDRYFRVPGDETYDLVVASAGGYPRDINFIQAHKSIHNAASFVKDGGTLVILAECADGTGNQDFMELFALGGREQIFAGMEKEYRNNAGTALSMLEKTERIRVRFVTSLDEETCRLMGAQRTPAEEVQGIISGAVGDMARIANASLLYR